MSLAAFIQEEVSRQAGEEAMRAKVQAHIDRTIEDAVKAAFSFGDAQKQIRQAVEKALELPGGLDVPSYGTMVLAVLRQKMDDVLSQLVNQRLAEEMESILRVGAREIKLSDIVDKMKEGEDQADRWGSSCTVIVEGSRSTLTEGYRTIFLDPEDIGSGTTSFGSMRSRHEAAAKISVDPDGKIYNLVINQKDAKTTVRMGPQYGWEGMIFALYATGGTLIVDEDNVDRSYGDY